MTTDNEAGRSLARHWRPLQCPKLASAGTLSVTLRSSCSVRAHKHSRLPSSGAEHSSAMPRHGGSVPVQAGPGLWVHQSLRHTAPISARQWCRPACWGLRAAAVHNRDPPQTRHPVCPSGRPQCSTQAAVCWVKGRAPAKRDGADAAGCAGSGVSWNAGRAGACRFLPSCSAHQIVCNRLQAATGSKGVSASQYRACTACLSALWLSRRAGFSRRERALCLRLRLSVSHLLAAHLAKGEGEGHLGRLWQLCRFLRAAGSRQAQQCAALGLRSSCSSASGVRCLSDHERAKAPDAAIDGQWEVERRISIAACLLTALQCCMHDWTRRGEAAIK